jgi:hypothetical protein
VLVLFTAVTSFGLLFDLPPEMCEDHKYILWGRIKWSTLGGEKKETRLFMAAYSCLDLALAFFNKIHSSFVAKPNLTAVKIHGFWLVVHRVLHSSESEFTVNVDP